MGIGMYILFIYLFIYLLLYSNNCKVFRFSKPKNVKFGLSKFFGF